MTHIEVTDTAAPTHVPPHRSIQCCAAWTFDIAVRRFVPCELEVQGMMMQMRPIGLRTAHVNDAAALSIAVLPKNSRFVDETVLSIQVHITRFVAS